MKEPAWAIHEQGKSIGRFYLDMHPRDNKYGHAAHWTLRMGLKDRQIPLSRMATNFPQGLMEHKQVDAFLHEFGYLLHNMFSGTQQWFDISGMTMERDFVEAPSRMLEQWVWNRDTATAQAYREKVIAPAGSKPAACLHEAFEELREAALPVKKPRKSAQAQ